MKTALSDAKLAIIRGMIELGKPDRLIADAVGVAPQTVNRIRNERGRYGDTELPKIQQACLDGREALLALDGCVRARQLPRNRRRFFA